MQCNFPDYQDQPSTWAGLFSFRQPDDALIINFSQNNSKAELWDSLTDSERNDIILAFNESEDENNLISFEEIKNKYNKWLSK